MGCSPQPLLIINSLLFLHCESVYGIVCHRTSVHACSLSTASHFRCRLATCTVSGDAARMWRYFRHRTNSVMFSRTTRSHAVKELRHRPEFLICIFLVRPQSTSCSRFRVAGMRTVIFSCYEYSTRQSFLVLPKPQNEKCWGPPVLK